MTDIDRRGRSRIWLGGIAVLVIAGLLWWGLSSSRQGDPRDVTLALDWFPQPSNAAAYRAEAKGYYRGRGLTVTIRPGSAQAVAVQLVASGHAQFGLETGAHILEARAQGIPLVAIAATFQQSPAALFFHKGQAIRDFHDLNGRTVYTQIAAPEWAYQKRKYGLDRVRDLQFHGSYAAFASDPTAVAQGYLTSTGDELAARGLATDSIRSAEDVGYASVLFTTEDMVRRHPDIVTAFVQATRQGWDDYRVHPLDTVRLLLPLTAGRPESSLLSESRRQQSLVWTGDALQHGWGWMTEGRWQQAIDQSVLEGAIPPMPASSVFTTRFLEQR